MNPVRLYVDEDAGEHAVIIGLRARGIDILTTLEALRDGTSDADQLAFAATQERSIYTFNVGDFAKLHNEYLRQGLEHWGIIAIPDQRYSIGEKIRRVAGLLSRVTSADMINRMQYL